MDTRWDSCWRRSNRITRARVRGQGCTPDCPDGTVLDGLLSRHRVDHGYCRRSGQRPPGPPLRGVLSNHVMTFFPPGIWLHFWPVRRHHRPHDIRSGKLARGSRSQHERSRTCSTALLYMLLTLPPPPGLCTHHGLLRVLWRAHGQHSSRRRHLGILHHLKERRGAVQPVLHAHPREQQPRPPRSTPRHAGRGAHERVHAHQAVGRVPALCVCDADDVASGGRDEVLISLRFYLVRRVSGLPPTRFVTV